MPGDPRIRAADADRERTASLLREHHAAGRLTAEEFHERMEKAMDARTMGELDELMTDLPAIDLYRLPDASLRRASPGSSQSLLPSDYRGGEVENLSPATTAMVAWAGVATVLLVIGLVAAIVVGAVVNVWAVLSIPAAIGWIWFLIRRHRH